VLDRFQSSSVREYRVHEGDKLHMECNAPRSLPNATFSWSIARHVDTKPLLLRDTRRMQIGSNGNSSQHSAPASWAGGREKIALFYYLNFNPTAQKIFGFCCPKITCFGAFLALF